jgi:hypothetical protein
MQELLAKSSANGEVAHFAQAYRRYRADSERQGRHYHRDIAYEHLYLIRLR